VVQKWSRKIGGWSRIFGFGPGFLALVQDFGLWSRIFGFGPGFVLILVANMLISLSVFQERLN
jgi:hypothetical protein